ncbi:MAG: chemotaxis protein CheW [Gammaproteobacteria bacterium]|nr:chemotaxis protein CheW [Gammaproteobacteria bacterium]
MPNSKLITDNDALLLYRVGPVLCCSPTHCIDSVVIPPAISRPPGVNELRPGVFKHVSGIVSIVDLRVAFGVDHERRNNSGRIIIVKLDSVHPGFWVDEIIDVIEYPEKGWSQVPAMIPRDIFERTLLLDSKIRLYCNFDKLYDCRETGYLGGFIARLLAEEKLQDSEVSKTNIELKKLVVKPGQQSVSDKPSILSDTSHGQPVSALSNMAIGTTEEPVAVKSVNIKNKLNDKELPEKMEVYKAADDEIKSMEISSHGVDSGAGIKSAKAGSEKTFEKSTCNTEIEGYKKHSPADADLQNGKHRQLSSRQDVVAEDNSSNWLLAGVIIGIAVLLSVLVSYLMDKNKSVTDQMEYFRVTNEYDDNVMGIDGTNTGVLDRSDLIETWPGDNDGLHEGIVTDDTPAMLSEGSARIEKDDQGFVIVIDRTGGLVETAAELENIIEDTGPGSADELQEVVEIVNNQTQQITSLSADDAGSEKQQATANNLSEMLSGSEPVELLLRQARQDSATDPESLQKSEKLAPKKEVVKNKLKRRQIIHIVVKGDTLWHIARRYINNPYLYPELARLSNIRNPDLIYPGNRVKIIIVERF